jgi:hypothetical protein
MATSSLGFSEINQVYYNFGNSRPLRKITNISGVFGIEKINLPIDNTPKNEESYTSHGYTVEEEPCPAYLKDINTDVKQTPKKSWFRRLFCCF